MTVQAANASAATNQPGDHLSPSGFDYNRIEGVQGNPHVTDAFIREVEAMADRLGTRPEYILAVMSFETGGSFDPAQKNHAGSGATGLIQFMPGTASGLGTSTEALSRMSSVEQLQYVEQYFNNRSDPGELRTLEGVYTAVLYGNPQPDPGTVLWSEGSSAYRWNSGLDSNHDGHITSGEATQHVRDQIHGDAPPPSDDGPSNPPPDRGNGGDYTVRSGDTLSGIAERHGVSLSALLRANPQIDDPNLIHPGQHINLPGGGGGNDSGQASTYTVRSGDTLSGIAERHDVSLSALLDANPGFRANPDMIHPGQTVRIPGGGGGSDTAPASHYTVRSGDTLSGIAERHGLTLDGLLAANPQFRSNPNLIHPGQSVRIPGGGDGGNPQPQPQPASNYTVRSGDTFSGIAQQHGLSVAELSRANPQIGNINLIYPGQTVRIPGGGEVEGPSGPGGPEGPDGPSGPSNNNAAQIAHEYLGWWAGDLKTSGHLPMNPNVPNDVCCANFVSAVLQEAGVIDFHTDLVTGSNSGVQGALGTELLERGWRRVPASQARPGDVAILNNGHHTELVYSNNNGDITLIGSNNTGGGSGPQQISYGNPYGGAWYLTPP